VNNELERVWVGAVISGTILAFAWTEKGKTMQTSGNCTQQGTQIHGSHINLLFTFILAMICDIWYKCTE
jgi:hypothetical protein